jgi:N-acetylmuramoyl-L-alanine amidase-like protein
MSDEKPRDFWGKVQIASSVFNGVLLATVALIATKCIDRRAEIERRAETARQDSLRHIAERHTQRLAELEAITKLLPVLTSKDSAQREMGRALLVAVSRADSLAALINEVGAEPASRSSNSHGPPATNAPSPSPAGASSGSVVDGRFGVVSGFVAIVFNPRAPAAQRSEATRRVAEIATDPTATVVAKREAAAAVVAIAADSGLPRDAREIARAALARIRSVSALRIRAVVDSQPVNRLIDEVVLHHTYRPTRAEYRGGESIFAIARFQIEQFGWDRLGWHFAVAPDGVIWLGEPLNNSAYHLGNASLNRRTVSVNLILDGDHELPTEAQRRSLVALMTSLFARFRIKPHENFAEGRGLHRGHVGVRVTRTCPGVLITRPLVLGWFDVGAHSPALEIGQRP